MVSIIVFPPFSVTPLVDIGHVGGLCDWWPLWPRNCPPWAKRLPLNTGYSRFRKVSATKARTLVLMLSNSSSCSSHRQLPSVFKLLTLRFICEPNTYNSAFQYFHFSVYTMVYQNLVKFHPRNCVFCNNIYFLTVYVLGSFLKVFNSPAFHI